MSGRPVVVRFVFDLDAFREALGRARESVDRFRARMDERSDEADE